MYYYPLASKKLGLKFLGPFKVTRKVNEVSYEIQAHATGKTKVVNVNHLKPYMSEVLPDDLGHLPDLPNHLDLDGLFDEPEVNDPPTGVLVDLDEDPNDPGTAEGDPSEPDLTNLFEGEQALNPEAPAFAPKRARRPPTQFGHNVGYF